VLRYARDGIESAKPPAQGLQSILAGVGKELARLRWGVARGAGIGVVIGASAGAGADIAAYVSYAVSRRLSRQPERFGTGITDGIGTASAANNASIGGAFVPATVFGIPGDSLTAIVIGVLYMKGLNPGPTVFLMKPDLINAVFIAYLVANLMLVPFGLVAIRLFKQILRVPQTVLMPLILSFCIVGAFAVENATFAVTAMLIMGIVGFFMEENGFPLAPAILGLVLGPMVEEMFLSSLIKADGELLYFLSRPLAAGLGGVTMLIWLVPPALFVRRWLAARPSR